VTSPSSPAAPAALAHVEPTWRADAACQGTTAAHFYPPTVTESRDERRVRENAARSLCAQCPVRTACLDYALYVQEPYGIWGGLTEVERRRLLRGGVGPVSTDRREVVLAAR
jgi:WhiB family redox-sensing transcriptional regulator